MEWLDSYEALKRVNRGNAFTVPDNYFQEKEELIMENIRLEQLKYAHPNNGFIVLANYFDELTKNIESRIAIDEVLNAEQGFAVPANYFDELTKNIESRIAIEEALNAESGFTVPANYFDELTKNIESRIAIDEALNTEQGFTVPANYFDELEHKILQSTINTPVRSIQQERGMIRKLWISKSFKYASAACFALVVGTAVMISEFNDTAIHKRSDIHKALSKVSDKDIEIYLQINGDTPAIMENVDPNSLNSLLSDEADQNKTN